jgi:hypothetical protein
MFSLSILVPTGAKVPKVADGAQRSIPYVFDTRATTNMMANIAIPMGDSSTFKKMLRKKAGTAICVHLFGSPAEHLTFHF